MSEEVSAISDTPSLSPVTSTFHSHLSNPLSFLSPSQSTYTHCTTALCHLHNLSLSLHPTTDTLTQLYTEGFDQEQIWQQLELWNTRTCTQLSEDIEQVLAADIQLLDPSQLDDNGTNTDVASDEDDVILESEVNGKDDSEFESEVASGELNVGTTDTDQFLNPELMEKFLVREEKRFYQEDKSAESSEGESPELSEGEEAVAAGMKYRDYFVEGEKGKDVEKDDTGVKSSYAQLKEKLQSRIEQLEQDNIAEKDWQLSGEVRSMSRPENSLLEEYMDHQSHPPPPLITHKTTEALEEMIRRRARDELWDDPVRRDKPLEKSYNPQSAVKRGDMDAEEVGQRKGLAEVYEEEYQRRADPGTSAQRGEERVIEEEVKKMMRELFSKLDALSNFRYTPRPYKYEPLVITNVPAVSVEEVLPSATSEATRLAPEEIEPPSRHAPVSELERTREDKRRSRRQKKRAMSRSMVLRAQKLVNRSNPGLGNRYSKRKLMEALRDAKRMQGQREKLLGDEKGKGDKSLRSSRAFFSKLEQQARDVVRDKSKEKDRKNKQVMAALRLKFS